MSHVTVLDIVAIAPALGALLAMIAFQHCSTLKEHSAGNCGTCGLTRTPVRTLNTYTCLSLMLGSELGQIFVYLHIDAHPGAKKS
jgi:hypothetical protein